MSAVKSSTIRIRHREDGSYNAIRLGSQDCIGWGRDQAHAVRDLKIQEQRLKQHIQSCKLILNGFH